MNKKAMTMEMIVKMVIVIAAIIIVIGIIYMIFKGSSSSVGDLGDKLRFG